MFLLNDEKDVLHLLFQLNSFGDLTITVTEIFRLLISLGGLYPSHDIAKSRVCCQSHNGETVSFSMTPFVRVYGFSLELSSFCHHCETRFYQNFTGKLAIKIIFHHVVW